MKKIALLCAICLFLTMNICVYASLGDDIVIEVSSVTDDIVTVSGSAPTDSAVAVMVLNPGQTLTDALDNKSLQEVQYLGAVYSSNGKFSCDIKMNTGTAQNKIEGKFSVFVSIDGKLVYSNNDFVFYSNETKESYLTYVKTGTYSVLAEKAPEIYKSFSISEHPLYAESSGEDIAKVICAQKNRESIESVSEATNFLLEVLLISAFNNSSATLVDNETGEFAYTNMWAVDGNGNVDKLYEDEYFNSLTDNGRNKMISLMLSTDYKDAQFGDILKNFRNGMFFHLIKNNVAMGTAFVEKLIKDYSAEYTEAGFNVSLLTSIKKAEERATKISKLLESSAENISGLAADFNKIFKKETNQSGSSSGGGGGGGVPSMGGGFKEDAPASTPAPSATPGPEAPPEECPFSDMGEAQWAMEAVEYLYKAGIINGRSETQFAPNETVTRAELVKMICEALTVAEAEEAITFSDVSDQWFAPYVKNAAAAGIVNGDGGYFKPNNAITREDAALIIYRAMGLEKGGEITFTDAESISAYAKDAIAAMVNGGYINGFGDGTFAPKNTLNRAQAAQLIYNMLTREGN